MNFLKKSLVQDQPFEVVILEKQGVKQTDYGPKWAYVMKMNGMTYNHEATETEEKNLQHVTVGMTVHGKMALNKFGKHSIYWDKVANRSDPIPQDTTAPSKDADEYKTAKAEKDIAICLQGFMQAFIIKGEDGKTALEHAILARSALQKTAKAIYDNEQSSNSITL